MNEVTISVVSHGHRDHLRNLLGDLNRIAAHSRLRVLLTLNIPEPEPQESDYPNLHLSVIHNARPRGFSANHNAAFERCATRWYVILNPDLRLPENPFPALLSHVENTPHIGVVAPRVINSAGEDEDHVRHNLSPVSLWWRRFGMAEPVDASFPAKHPSPFYWLAGMFLMFNSEAYRAVGGFDERFFMYCEDYDICARLYAQGHGLSIASEAHAIHEAQRDSHRSLRHLQWHVTSLLKVWSSRVFWRLTLSRFQR